MIVRKLALAKSLRRTMIICVLLGASGCTSFDGLRGNEEETRRAVAAKIPAGTPIASAIKTMTAARYRCDPFFGKSEVMCRSTTLMQDSDWRVIFTVRDSVVVNAKVSQWNTFL
jgi:hypothetical protein